MKYKIIPIVAVALTAILLGCPNEMGTGTLNMSEVLEDAKTIQATIPLLEASLSLIQPGTIGLEASDEGTVLNARNIYPGIEDNNDFDPPETLPATPAELWASSDTSKGYARFPSSGYIHDFYGETGLEAYFELRETTDGWGTYQVRLYKYPTLSAAVEYSFEEYRVTDSWYNLIATDGTTDPLAYEELSTRYFDNRVERRTLLASRWGSTPNVVYVTDYFTIPADFDSADWSNYDIVQPSTATPNDTADNSLQEYSSWETGVISAGSADTTVTEFYLQKVNDTETGFDKYSKSYVTDTFREKGVSNTTNTIRYYTADADGNKTVKAKTIGNMKGKKGASWLSEVTEEITIAKQTSGTFTYDSDSIRYKDGLQESSTTVSLTEDGAGLNTFTGTLTTNIEGTVSESTVSLSSDSGIDITPRGVAAKAVAFNISAADRVVTFNNLKYGSFEGEIAGGYLEGLYTTDSGIVVDIFINPSLVVAGDEFE